MIPELTQQVLEYKSELEKLEPFISSEIFENLNPGERKNLKDELNSLDKKITSSDIPNYFKENFLKKTKNYSRLVSVSQNSDNPSNPGYISETFISSLIGVVIGFFGSMGIDLTLEEVSKKFFEGYMKGVYEK